MNFQAIVGIFLISILAVSGCLDVGGRKPAPELCNQVSNGFTKSTCFHRVAVRTGNPVYCGLISEMSSKDQCFTDLAEGNTWIGGGAGFD